MDDSQSFDFNSSEIDFLLEPNNNLSKYITSHAIHSASILSFIFDEHLTFLLAPT